MINAPMYQKRLMMEAGRRLEGGWEEAGRRLEGGWKEKDAVRMLEGGWNEAGRQPCITIHTHTYTYMVHICVYV